MGTHSQELAGVELKAAMDAVCSRHLEALLIAADAAQLGHFLGPLVADPASFYALVTRCGAVWGGWNFGAFSSCVSRPVLHR